MSDFTLIKGNKMKLFNYVYLARIAYMHSFHERKSIKENETRVNTLLNQFTYKLKEKRKQTQKHIKKDQTEQNKFT